MPSRHEFTPHSSTNLTNQHFERQIQDVQHALRGEIFIGSLTPAAQTRFFLPLVRVSPLTPVFSHPANTSTQHVDSLQVSLTRSYKKRVFPSVRQARVVGMPLL